MQNIVRLTKEFRFEAAHALVKYDGKCRNLHGHSYLLYVTVKGTPIDDTLSPKDGMFIDFKELKRVVNSVIIDIFDHSLILKEGDSLSHDISNFYDNVQVLPFRPTTENLIIHFASLLKKPLKEIGGNLFSLRLYETPTSYAEWYADENN